VYEREIATIHTHTAFALKSNQYMRH